MKFNSPSTFAAVAGLSVAVGSLSANAGLVGDAFVVTATNTSGVDSFVVPASSLTWTGDSWIFNTPEGWSASLTNGVTLTDISTEYVEDPMIFFNFGISTGGVATTFTVSSAVLTFPSLLNANAYASSGFTLTDNGGEGSGIVGNFGGDSYSAVYNGSSVYDTQLTSFSFASAFQTQTQNQNTVAGVIPGFVSSMQASWNFTVAANDSVGATSTWVIIPTPGALALIGMGTLMVSRRRR
jgi:hypothetical protein